MRRKSASAAFIISGEILKNYKKINKNVDIKNQVCYDASVTCGNKIVIFVKQMFVL